MLAGHKLNSLLDIVKGSTKEELAWINGYLSGLLSATEDQQPALQDVAAVPVHQKLTITYGTETGNSKKVALDFAARAKQHGLIPKIISLDQYRLNDLPKEEFFVTIISTQGEGEPPEAAKKFYDHIHNNGFKLPKLKYSVLALGDTSYPLFCKAGEDVDHQLGKMGASRILPITRCDVEFDSEAARWVDDVIKTIGSNTTVAAPPVVLKEETKKPAGKQIYSGTIISSINMHDHASAKTTWHIELAAGQVDYEPGDSIGIVPENDKLLVKALLAFTGADAAKEISYKSETFSIEDFLLKKVSIVHLLPSVIKKYAALTGHSFPDGRYDLVDLLKNYPVKNAEQLVEVFSLLTPIAPRIYTVASSPAAHADEIHLTVAKDVFEKEGVELTGLCSAFFEKKTEEDEIRFFVQKNKRFRLPDAGKDVIMIGPETGIAAFRSFLAERDATGATGRNWLFFGEKNFYNDFLYQTEIQNWQQTGLLTKTNVAFEDDGLFVQNKMWQHRQEFYQWIKDGAYVYVCGIKDPMSIEVEKMLLQIFESCGDAGNAQQAFDEWKQSGRYAKDVY